MINTRYEMAIAKLDFRYLRFIHLFSITHIYIRYIYFYNIYFPSVDTLHVWFPPLSLASAPSHLMLAKNAKVYLSRVTLPFFGHFLV